VRRVSTTGSRLQKDDLDLLQDEWRAEDCHWQPDEPTEFCMIEAMFDLPGEEELRLTAALVHKPPAIGTEQSVGTALGRDRQYTRQARSKKYSARLKNDRPKPGLES
jgi:hypothetical protein